MTGNVNTRWVLESPVGRTVHTDDLGFGIVLEVIDADNWLVKFEDSPHAIEVEAADLEMTDAPDDVGPHAFDSPKIEEWY